jgi:hypothetical protein
MEVKQKLPQRKTPRAQWIEYNTGIYFVTVCTQNFIHYFGEISNGEIQLTELGNYLVTQIEESNQHHSYIEVLQYVVMPNHFHAIVEVKGTDSMRTQQVASLLAFVILLLATILSQKISPFQITLYKFHTQCLCFDIFFAV